MTAPPAGDPPRMREIVPGLRVWTREYEKIGQPVSSYLLTETGVVLNPLLPDGGVDALREHAEVRAVVLTNRHHVRDIDAILDAFGASLHVPEAGVEEVGRGAQPYRPGDALPGGGVALEVGILSPDEAAVHFPSFTAIATADGVIRDGEGPLTTVPDGLLGDEPEQIRAGLRERFGQLAELEPEHLLVAHGPPLVGGAAQALRDFAAG